MQENLKKEYAGEINRQHFLTLDKAHISLKIPWIALVRLYRYVGYVS